ncbi:uncharacterized protein LOC116041123 [Sander lucioperca]|uniref:uncharacterized protein LOC116041123 n=1 Tax=Sander lucioperca TaxID=283035 RepID=UPI00125E018B|nr:uncharacterized protein LOC116041123 [Sander lucioperca]
MEMGHQDPAKSQRKGRSAPDIPLETDGGTEATQLTVRRLRTGQQDAQQKGGSHLVAHCTAIMSVSWRQCAIQITNECSTYDLDNPCAYMESGVCTEPLPPQIDSNSTGSALFTKTANAARGAVGVFTYDLIKKSTKNAIGKIAVMFCVPYDYVLYFNLYAVGIFDESQAFNNNLYQLMYYDSNSNFIRGKATGPCLSHTDGQVTIMGTMSDSYQPVMKVVVKDN